MWDTDHWRQLVTVDTMPSHGIPPDGPSEGVYSIAVAPSDSDVIYMVYGGDLYKSTNKGLTFAATGFTHRSNLYPNDNYRTHGQKLAVDPADPNHVIAGTLTNGVFRTTDGGTNWSATSITAASDSAGPATNAGHTGIAFDPTSGTTGGRTNVIYAGSWNNGVWRSADAGATWTRISTTILYPKYGKVGNASGVYYCTCVDAGKVELGALHRYTGSWTDITPSHRPETVVIDTADNTKLYAVRDSGHLNISTDSGATWGGTNFNLSRTATDVPWLAETHETYMSVGDVVPDPLTADKLWFAQGIGVWHCDNPGAATTAWISQSAGIEQLVASWVWSVPGGAVYTCSWDRPLFKITDPDTYPSDHYPNYDHAIIRGYSIEHATDDPTFLVACAEWSTDEESSYSDDSGATWTPFAAYPPQVWCGGHIAVSTKLNWVWQNNNKKPTYYTTDGGVTWTKITLPSPFVDDTSENGWAGIDSDWRIDRHVVCADRVMAGTFYLYHFWHGIFRSTDGGATWTRRYTSTLNTYGLDYWNGKLKAVPGQAGHLFWCSGQAGGANPVDTAFLKRSTDGGLTWSSVSNVLEAYDVGFGLHAPGETYPAVYIVGWVSNEYGIWRSDDDCATWTKIGDYPLGSLDWPTCISGDENTYGRCYVGFKGSGFAYYG